MARLPRLVVSGEPHHVMQRTVAGADAFPAALDVLRFREALQRSSREHDVALHAYALSSPQVQLLATPRVAAGLGRMMQALARFYVPAFNRRHAREGSLWQVRFKAAPVGGAGPLLLCMRYIEQAAQRCDDANGQGEHATSSAAAHIGKTTDLLLSAVPIASGYWQLGNTPFEREAAYRSLLEQPLSIEDMRRIESTTVKGWALGTTEFFALLARTPGLRRAVGGRVGRPPLKKLLPR